MVRISAFAIAALSAATCACTLQPGLANGPQLGGTPDTDSHVHDAIANGPDSCGRRLDPGPLRNRIIPCPRTGEPRSIPPSAAPSTGSDPVIMRWLNHYHAHWPCQEDVNPSIAMASGDSCPGVGSEK